MASKIDKLSSNNLIIVMLLISLIVVGITFLASKSLYKTIARNNTVVQKKHAAEKMLQTDIDNAPGLVSAYTNLGDKKRKIEDALPNTLDFPSLLVTLENISGTSGQKLKTVLPGLAGSAVEAPTVVATGAETPVPVAYKFGITTTGSYQSMIQMLRGLESSARPMRIVDAQFAGGGSVLNSTFTIETYYQDVAKLPFSTETVK